jgi:hypothetical protein
MIPVLPRRVRIVTATIVVLMVGALLSAPPSVLSIVVDSDDHPLPPAPPALDLASGKTTPQGKQHVRKKQDEQRARLVSEPGTFDHGIGPGIDHLEHQARELMGDLLTDDPIELTQIPFSFDDDGRFDGFDSLQAGHLPSYTFNNGVSGFARGGVPFVPGVGGFGGAASGGGSTGHSESADGSTAGSGNSDTVQRGIEPDARQPGATENGPETEGGFVPKAEDDVIVIDVVRTNPEVPSGNGDGSDVEPPSSGSPGPVAPVPVPEPASLVLTGFGLAGLVAWNRRAARAGRQHAGLPDSHVAEKRGPSRP